VVSSENETWRCGLRISFPNIGGLFAENQEVEATRLVSLTDRFLSACAAKHGEMFAPLLTVLDDAVQAGQLDAAAAALRRVQFACAHIHSGTSSLSKFGRGCGIICDDT
jgi:hypothetical protein